MLIVYLMLLAGLALVAFVTLYVMAETGFIGFFLYLRIIYLTFKQFKGLDSPNVSMRRKLLALSVLSSYSGYLLYIFFGNQSYSDGTFLYMGLCGAVGTIGLAPDTEEETEMPAERPVLAKRRA